jgi:hypothetical protein
VSEPRPVVPRTLAAGAVLVLLGLLLWALHAVQSSRERHSYTAGGNPPTYVRLVAGHRYWISIPDGVRREAQFGVSPGALECTAARPGQAPGALDVTAEQNGTKAINQIASFTSGLTGTVQVQCAGLGAVYVDDAEGSFDWAGLWLVLASIALAVGLPLTLSGLRSVRHPADADATD